MTENEQELAARRARGHRGGQSKKAAASGWIGSALEYYDFFIYATAAALVFPAIFFDKSDPKMGIIGALGTYGVGYVARPIGAFVLGSYGDKHGRKKVLVTSMFMMGISTFLVALLPTYKQVGFLAPALLIILRLIQGFAVGGEQSGSASMILEHAPFGRRGFFGSFTLQGTQFGQIFAAALFLPLAQYLSPDAFSSWGWRIPFLFSAFVVLAGWMIRRRVEETPAFVEEVKEGATIGATPIRDAFSENRKTIFLIICIAMMNVIPTTTTVFGATFATNKSYGVGLNPDVYLWIPILGNILAVLLIPYVGSLSDKIGRRPCIIFGALTSGIMSFGYLWAISQHNVALAIFFSLAMWGAAYQGYNAVFPTFYPEQFPTKTRVTGMAVSQNIANLLTSMMPLLYVVIVPPGSTNVVLVVGGITFATTCLSAAAAYFSRETYRIDAHDLGDPNATPIPKGEYERRRQEGIDLAEADKVADLATV